MTTYTVEESFWSEDAYRVLKNGTPLSIDECRSEFQALLFEVDRSNRQAIELANEILGHKERIRQLIEELEDYQEGVEGLKLSVGDLKKERARLLERLLRGRIPL